MELLFAVAKPQRNIELRLRHAGVMFPAAFIQSAAYEASLRVQSERSERLRELTPAARRRSERLRELTAEALRRELTPAARWRSVPRCFFQSAAYEASLRVQSERSERLRELTPAARRRSERLRELHEVQGSRELAPWRIPKAEPLVGNDSVIL